MPDRVGAVDRDPAAVLGRLGNVLLDGRGPFAPPSRSAEPTAPVVELASPVVAVGELAEGEWQQLVASASAERVTGLVAAAVGTGVLEVSDEQRMELADRHREAMAVALELERLLLDTIDLLHRNGIDAVVLKGPAVAHLVYPDSSIRDFGDVDVLVPGEQLPRAVRALCADGAVRAQVELAPGWDGRFAKSVTLRSRSGYEIDLHRTIAPGAFGLRGDPAVLFARTQPLVVGGVALRALSPEGQLFQACMHTAAGNRRVWLSSIADIVQLSRSGRVDADAFRALVREWGAAAVVEAAGRQVAERMDRVDVPLLHAGLVDDQDRRLLQRYGGGFRGPALGAFAVLPPRDWLPYARCLAWPSRENLASRGLTRRTHLRRLRA